MEHDGISAFFLAFSLITSTLYRAAARLVVVGELLDEIDTPFENWLTI